MYDFSNFFCSKEQGFTFVEILVACSIIIALAVGAIFLGSAILDNGRYNKAKTDTATISTAIGQYKFELGSFPKSIDDLTKKDGQYGPYLSSDILKDPWGNDYHLVSIRLLVVLLFGVMGTTKPMIPVHLMILFPVMILVLWDINFKERIFHYDL